MKHVTVADKSLLIGDEATDVLLDYAALIAQIGGGARVDLNAVSSDGDVVVASFLLNSGTVLVAETTTNSLPEPDNAETIALLRARLASYRSAAPDGMFFGMGDTAEAS